MLHATAILGDVGEPRFRGRVVERVLIDAAEASKRKLRRQTEAGTDVAIDLPRGSYLAHGSVLADDGRRVVVVERKHQEALVVRLSAGLTPEELLEHAVRLGHAFGNQHVPVEVENGEIRIPITTSREVARATVEGLGLAGIELRFARIPLGRERPLLAGHAH